MTTSGVNYSGELPTAAAATVFTALSLGVLLSIIITLLLTNKKPAAAGASSKLPPLPPSPASWPVVGNLPEILTQKSMFRWVHNVMKDMNTDICLIRLPCGGPAIVPVLDPAIAREVLRKQDAIFADRPVTVGSEVISGGHVTTAVVPYSEQWRKMRKVLVSEIVSPARVRWLHGKRAEEADNLTFYVHRRCMAGKSVNVRVATQHYCGNVTRKMLFGQGTYFGEPVPDGGPGPAEVEHLEALFTALKYLYWSCLSDYLPPVRGWDVDGNEKIIKEADKTIKALQDPLIDERIRQWRSGERKQIDDLVDVFITLEDDDGRPLLTPHEIKNQAAEMMMAAVDNPSSAVEWAMAELINQPDLMAKATAEIDRVTGGSRRLVQESDIGALNYVKACIRESFRLHPVFPFNLPHVSTKDTTVAGYFIPKGSYVLLSRYGLGRNPKVWPDPLKFDPDRHLNDVAGGGGGGGEVGLAEHELRFISFGTGRRGCVATGLGSCMVTVLLARLIQGFSWAPAGEAEAVDLAEAEDELSLASPLVAVARPRLARELYPSGN